MNPFVKYPVIFISKITNSGAGVYRQDFNECAGTYDDVVTRPILARATEEMLNTYGPLEGDACLDLGCGTGHSTEIIARSTGPQGLVSACDFSENMITRAAKKLQHLPNVFFFQGDMVQTLEFFGTGEFNFAGLFWSLEYVNHADVLKKIFRE